MYITTNTKVGAEQSNKHAPTCAVIPDIFTHIAFNYRDYNSYRESIRFEVYKFRDYYNTDF